VSFGTGGAGGSGALVGGEIIRSVLAVVGSGAGVNGDSCQGPERQLPGRADSAT
jgi:hypothetical protein